MFDIDSRLTGSLVDRELSIITHTFEDQQEGKQKENINILGVGHVHIFICIEIIRIIINAGIHIDDPDPEGPIITP